HQVHNHIVSEDLSSETGFLQFRDLHPKVLIPAGALDSRVKSPIFVEAEVAEYCERCTLRVYISVNDHSTRHENSSRNKFAS
ncbi:MAG: hypothetical protein V3U49_00795, partial [Nitrososphaerales archaeon]